MTSEWMKVMLEEISRKKAEAEAARIEQQMRDDERLRDGEQVRDGEQLRDVEQVLGGGRERKNW